jgi:hypothetical protein
MTRLAALPITLAVALAAAAGPTHAQGDPRAAPSPMTGRTLGGALLGAGIGALVGGYVGAHVSSRGCESGNPDACLGEAFPGFIVGFGVGHTLGAPAGAHLLNGRRGGPGRSLAVSAAVFAAEVLALNALVDDGRTRREGLVIGIAAAAPVVQILTSAIIEHRTARAAARSAVRAPR